LDWVGGSCWPKAAGLSPLWNVVEDGNDVISGDMPDGFCSLDYGKLEEFSGLGRGFFAHVSIPLFHVVMFSLAVEET
jgi:hypothetical protein